MNLTPQQYERIQLYLDGRMTAAEEAAFLREAETDEAVKEHLAFEKELRSQLLLLEMDEGFLNLDVTKAEGVREAEAGAMQQRIEAIGKKWKEGHNLLSIAKPPVAEDEKVIPLKKDSRPMWVSMAAACVVLLICGALWLIVSRQKKGPDVAVNPDSASSQKLVVVNRPPDSAKNTVPLPPRKNAVDYAALAKRFFKKEPAPAPEETPPYLRNALAAYDEDVYDNLIAKLDVDNPPVSRSDVKETQAVKELGHYYKGLALMETGDTKAAVKNLRWVADSAATESLVIKGKWQLALALLKEGKAEEAKGRLKELRNVPTKSPYKTKASQLLDEISN